ncbi:MAG: hypothetical protein LBC12_00420 [Nitrososphaerota archaeon]|jgi:hypothetical protein|nr:hypothetical protein [Nitrososphaerota archaeon]
MFATPTILVVGDLGQIWGKLDWVEQICGDREREGFGAEELEFEYEFVAAQGCCGHCEQLDGSIYRGPFIVSEFPFAVQAGEEVWLVGYHPNCQCILKLRNKVEGAVGLLYGELVVVEG